MDNNNKERINERPEYENHEQYTFNYDTFAEFIGDLREALYSIVFMK